jgi:hypothetical protein
VQQLIARTQAHTPEPAPGTFRASSGEEADLFNMNHYPVQAVCRVCQEPIEAQTFLRAFQHTADD